MKVIKFSRKYRPRLWERVAAASQLTTTRLFDDKALSVGDEVSLVKKETGDQLADGVIVRLCVSTFDKA